MGVHSDQKPHFCADSHKANGSGYAERTDSRTSKLRDLRLRA